MCSQARTGTCLASAREFARVLATYRQDTEALQGTPLFRAVYVRSVASSDFLTSGCCAGVVLNACNSERTGQELAALNVPNISATGRLPDCAAQRFSEEFWKAVGKEHTFSTAFQSAVDILSMEVVEGYQRFLFLPGQALPKQFTDQPVEWWRQKHAACVVSAYIYIIKMYEAL